MISKKVTCHNAAAATATGEVMNLESISLVALQVSGTFVATVTFQGTVDESNWVALQGTNINDGSVATAATAAGIWLIPVSGLKKFRANLAWTSGTSITVVARGAEYGVGLTLADIDVAGAETVTNAMLGAATTDAAVVTDATGTIHQYLRGLVKLIVAKINIATVDAVTTITNAVAVTNAVLGGATSDAAVITDATGTVHQYLRGIVKLLAAIITVKIDQTTPGTTNAVYSKPVHTAPLAYRTAVAAADVMAIPGAVTCTKINGAGALTAGTYYIKVVAVNAYGRTTARAGNVTVVTETVNLCVKAAFAQVVGATHYDIYCTTAADPLWVGRITEAQRASGIIIDAVGSTAAGGAVDSVYIYAIGTGLAAGVTAVVNTAYVIPASPVVCTGYMYCDFTLTFSRTGDAVAPALTVCPFFLNSRTSVYQQGQDNTIAFGGTTGALGSMQQRLRVEVRGEEAVALLVKSIAGTGAALNVDYVLS